MGKQIDSTHRSAIEFNLQTKEILEEVCVPLCHYGVAYFTYSRTFKDGKKLYISSSQKWVELYVEKNLQDDHEHLNYYIPSLDIRHALWSGFKRDKVFDALYEFDFWNGFTFFEHYKDYTDSYDFATYKEKGNIVNFYLNSIELLEKVIDKFKKKINDFIDFSDQSTLIVPKNYPFIKEVKRSRLIEKEKIRCFKAQTRLKERPVINTGLRSLSENI